MDHTQPKARQAILFNFAQLLLWSPFALAGTAADVSVDQIASWMQAQVWSRCRGLCRWSRALHGWLVTCVGPDALHSGVERANDLSP